VFNVKEICNYKKGRILFLLTIKLAVREVILSEISVYHTTLFRVLFLGPVWGPGKALFSPDPPHHSYKYTCRAICGAMYQVHPLCKSPKLPIPRAIWWCDNYLAYFFGGCPWHLSDNKKPKQKANQFHLLAAYYKIYLFVCWAFFMVLRFNRKNKGENRNKQQWEPRWGNIIICFVVLANIFASHLCLPFIFFCTLNVLAFSTFLSLFMCVCVSLTGESESFAHFPCHCTSLNGSLFFALLRSPRRIT